MSVEETKAIGPLFFKEQDRLHGGPADELCAPTYTAHIGSNPPLNLDGHKQFAAMFYAAFPDIYHTVEETVAEGDKVAVRFTLRGTHTDNFMGIPPTGKPIIVSAMAVMRVLDGKVTELRAEFDQMGLMQQLGVIPAPEQG